MTKEQAMELHWKIQGETFQNLDTLYKFLLGELPRGYWPEIIPTMHMGAITGHKVVVKWWNNPGTFAHKVQITPKGETYAVFQPLQKFFRVDRWAANGTGISHEYLDTYRDFIRDSSLRQVSPQESEGREHITIQGFLAKSCNALGWEEAIKDDMTGEPKHYMAV